jgi:hypothetical protein
VLDWTRASAERCHSGSAGVGQQYPAHLLALDETALERDFAALSEHAAPLRNGALG